MITLFLFFFADWLEMRLDDWGFKVSAVRISLAKHYYLGDLDQDVLDHIKMYVNAYEIGGDNLQRKIKEYEEYLTTRI